MKSLFEEMGGIYRQVGDYFIPNLILPDDSDYQIGKYGRLRRNYLKEHRKILYTNYVVEAFVSYFLFCWLQDGQNHFDTSGLE